MYDTKPYNIEQQFLLSSGSSNIINHYTAVHDALNLFTHLLTLISSDILFALQHLKGSVLSIQQVIQGYLTLQKRRILVLFHPGLHYHLDLFQHLNIAFQGSTLMHF
jgi:hypothetical protein